MSLARVALQGAARSNQPGKDGEQLLALVVFPLVVQPEAEHGEHRRGALRTSTVLLPSEVRDGLHGAHAFFRERAVLAVREAKLRRQVARDERGIAGSDLFVHA